MRRFVLAGLAASSVSSFGLAAAVPLNPTGFASLGTLTSDLISSYTFNTGDGTAAPTLTRVNTFNPADTTVYTGVISNGVAVFDFDAITLSSGARVTGTLPIALLSRSAATFGGLISAQATGTTAGPGGGSAGVNGTIVTTTPGGGPGGGSQAQGGAYGNYGGSGVVGTTTNNTAYGAIDDTFRGGSGGGAGNASLPAIAYGDGGAGGGGVHVSALGDISFVQNPNVSNAFGGIRVDGGDGEGAFGSNGGGGSGGGVFLATPGRVINNGLLSAAGGDSGASTNFGVSNNGTGNAGGGSGGRILVEAGNGYLQSGTFNGLIDVGGGVGFSGGSTYLPGNAGTFFVTGYTNPIPEPAALATLALGVTLATRRRR